MISKRLIISGIVQGIGYRKWLQEEAQKFHVVGWVKNRNDGAVEAVVSGLEMDVFLMIDQAWHGPPLAKVTDIAISEYSPSETFSTFRVVQ